MSVNNEGWTCTVSVSPAMEETKPASKKIRSCLERLNALHVAAGQVQPGQTKHEISAAFNELSALESRPEKPVEIVPLGKFDWGGGANCEYRLQDGKLFALKIGGWQPSSEEPSVWGESHLRTALGKDFRRFIANGVLKHYKIDESWLNDGKPKPVEIALPHNPKDVGPRRAIPGAVEYNGVSGWTRSGSVHAPENAADMVIRRRVIAEILQYFGITLSDADMTNCDEITALKAKHRKFRDAIYDAWSAD